MAEKITVFDLEDGKVDIDTLEDIVNLQEETTETRLSGPVKTWYGWQQDLQSQVNAVVSNVENDAGVVLAGLGYLPPVAYAAGIDITSGRQTVEYDGNVYAPLENSIPFTTSGTFESGSFRLLAGITASDLASDAGASLVGFDGGPIDLLLENAQSLPNYSAIRAYSGRSKMIRVTDPVTSGVFRLDSMDTTSQDDGGVVIVDAAGRRWKRDISNKEVTLEQFGALGNGSTDDSLAIAAALQAGFTYNVKVKATKGRVYVTTFGNVIKNGVDFQFSGAVFRMISTNSTTPIFSLMGNNSGDEISVFLPGTRRGLPIFIDGPNVNVNLLKVTSEAQQGPVPANQVAVQLTSNAIGIDIGRVHVENFDRAFSATGAKFVSIGFVYVRSFTRAIYLDDCVGVHFESYDIATKGPNASINPGDNAVLIQSTTGATNQIWFKGGRMADSGEHLFRVGGNPAGDIFVLDTLFTNSGSAGLKIQGAEDNGTGQTLTTGVYCRGCTFEDCGYDEMSINQLNTQAVQAKFLRFFVLEGAVVRRKNKLYSCHTGIYVLGCDDVQIINPIVTNAKFDSVRISTDQTGISDVNRLTISGGNFTQQGRHGVWIDYPRGNLSRINVDASVTNWGVGSWACLIAQGNPVGGGPGTGALSNCHVSIIAYSNSSDTVSCDNTQVMMQNIGGFTDTTARNGSIWQTTAGSGGVKIRKGGAWVDL